MFLVSILQTAHLWANTGVVFRELSFSRLECGVHDRLHIYPLCGIFYFPWHRHQIEGTNVFYCLIRKTERFTISNVESQVFTPNNSRLDPGSNPGCPRDKRMSYHWTNCASQSKYCLDIDKQHVNNRIFQLGNAYICSIAFQFQHKIKIIRGSIRA